ncbi:RNA polymerase beta subunit [Vibrio phage BONAISHI]|nr:RNA polymerase beta subunit [Vibrio phage BONAISHI]
MVTKLKSSSVAQGAIDASSSYEKFDSASRTAMLVSQESQVPDIENPELSHSLHGFEKQLADFTTSIRMPANGTVVLLLDKFRVGNGALSVRKNTHRVLIFHNEETNRLDAIELKAYSKLHDMFANKLIEEPIVRNLMPGTPLEKGTLLARTHSVLSNGLFSNSTQANMLYMSHPACIEDGMLVNSEYLERVRPQASVRLSGEYGKEWYPLDLYPNGMIYGAFPSNGSKLRDDNLVFAMRKKDRIFDVVNMLPEMLRRPDLTGHDRLVYAPPEAVDAEVIDIDVINTTKDSKSNPGTPVGMEALADIYHKQKSNFYETLLDVGESYKRENKVEYSDSMHTLMYEAYGNAPNSNRSRYFKNSKPAAIRRVIRGVETDEWHIDIKIAWKFPYGMGAKGSGLHGNKGVACKILPPERMPRDENGNIADVVVYGPGCVARLNPGQLYEHFAGGVKRDFRLSLLEQRAAGVPDENLAQQLLEFYKLVSPPTYEATKNKTPKQLQAALETIFANKIITFDPGDNDWMGVKWARAVENRYPPRRTRIYIENEDGVMEPTIDRALIAPVSFIWLDKSHFKPMSIAVPKLNNFRLPSTQNKTTKVSSPVNLQAPRAAAEDELRSYFAAAGPVATLNHIEISTNPDATEMTVRKAMQEGKPTAMRGVIDRSKIAYGSGANVEFVKHILGVMSIEVTEAA